MNPTPHRPSAPPSRHRPRRTALAATAALLLATALAAQTRARPAPGATGGTRPVQAWGVRWEPDLDAAADRARGRKQPVVWFRVLGELEGAT